MLAIDCTISMWELRDWLDRQDANTPSSRYCWCNPRKERMPDWCPACRSSQEEGAEDSVQ